MRAVLPSRLATITLFQVILLPAVVSAFSFTFSSNPTQCSSLTVTVDGGTAPYRLNLIPAGPMPGGATEIRKIVDEEFSDKTFKLDALRLPSGSQFIAMVSDATGVGTGGTSAILTVAESDNTSCLPTETSKPLFLFFLNPETITLCNPVNISWDTPQGDVTLAGIIPGGQSFQIPVSSGASSTTWTPQVEPGTQIYILAGDSRGRGTGGSSAAQSVANGSRSCLNGGAYSSTQSPYAGQVTATSSPTGGSNGDGGGNNVPLIVGVVVGVLALFALAGALLYLRYRRRKQHPTRYGNKVDLFKNDDDDDVHNEPPSALEPTPFLPPPTIQDPEQASERGSFESRGRRYSGSTFLSGVPPLSIGYAPSSNSRPLSAQITGSTNMWDDSRTDTGTHITSLLDGGRPHTPGGFSVTNPDVVGPVAGGSGARESRKEPPPRMRPVNIVQHQDAGSVEPPVDEEAELVELPPSYADVRRSSIVPDTAPPPPAPPTTAPPP